MSVDTYNRSREIEVFLQKVLKVKLGTKAYSDLKGLYQGIVYYDEGNGLIAPSQHKKQVQRLLKYFEKAMNLIAKKNTEKQVFIDQLKMRMQYMNSAKDIWNLYDQIKDL